MLVQSWLFRPGLQSQFSPCLRPGFCFGFLLVLFWSSSSPQYLFGQLLLTQLIQGVELPAEDLVLPEPGRGQLHSHDDGSVRNHHGHGPELDLQVFREFLSTGVTRVLKGQKIQDQGYICSESCDS